MSQRRVRMGLYEEAYGYTRLRLVVSAAELWLGLLFVLVLLAGCGCGRPGCRGPYWRAWSARFSLSPRSTPDRFIAGQNVDRFNRTGRVDLFYLSGLSPDAAPELARLPVEKRSCALELIGRSLSEGQDSWSSYNRGRSRARAIPAQGRCESP